MRNIYEDITIIIVCFKSYDLIKKNLNALKVFKTVMIDNSNCKKTYDLVKNHNNIKFIGTSKNLGYGQANNLGVSHSNTEFILILNPDIIVDESSILTLYKKIKEYDNIGVLAPSLYSQDNKRRTNGSKSFLVKSHKKIRNINNFASGDTCYDYVIGCALFMNRNFYKKIGGFDKRFFMYFEDNDICDRIYESKKIVVETPSSKMVHMQGESSKIDFIIKTKLSIIHKISEFIYLSKNISKFNLYKNLGIQFIDYTQRMFFNIITFKIKKSFKNLLRIISIILFITSVYKLI